MYSCYQHSQNIFLISATLCFNVFYKHNVAEIRIVYATITLFPIIILVESVVHVVALLAPLGLDAKIVFLAPYRMK